MSDAELEAHLNKTESRDRLVLQFGAMIYAATMTQAVIERSWTAVALGVGSLCVTLLGYRWMTR
jgi:hypothetical protein